MKAKRFFACLLVLMMLFGALGTMGVNAAGTSIDETTDILLAETESGVGTYTDTTVEPDTVYEYIVVGSDGSVSTVSILEETVVGTVYKKYTGSDPATGNYLIVSSKSEVSDLAMGNTRVIWDQNDVDQQNNGNLCLDNINIQNGKVENVAEKYIWYFEKNGTNYTIRSVGADPQNYNHQASGTDAAITAAEGSYLTAVLDNGNYKGYGLQFVTTAAEWSLTPAANPQHTWALGCNTANLNTYKGSFGDSTRGVGLWKDGTTDPGNLFYLFSEQYTVKETEIASLIENVGDASGYTAASFAVYTEKLKAAREIYATKSEVVAAYEALSEAVQNLEPSVWAGIVESCYDKITFGTDEEPTIKDGGIYLIVGAHDAGSGHTAEYTSKNKVISNTNLAYYQLANAGTADIARITESHFEGGESASQYEWVINSKDGKYTVQSTAGGYIDINNNNTGNVRIAEAETSLFIENNKGNGYTNYANGVRIGEEINGTRHKLNHRSGAPIGTLGTWSGDGTGNTYYLYGKSYCINAAKLAEVTANVGTDASIYTTDSWNTYNTVLTAINNGFDTPEKAYVAYLNLLDSAKALVKTDVAEFVDIVYEKAEIKGTAATDHTIGKAVENGRYIILGTEKNGAKHKALNSDAEISYSTSLSSYLTADGKRIKTQSNAYEWYFTWSEDGYVISAADDMKQYLYITDENSLTGVTIKSDIQHMKLAYANLGSNSVEIKDSVHIGGVNTTDDPSAVGFINKRNDNGAGTWNGDGNGDFPDNGSSYYLFKRVFVVNETKIANLTNGLNEADYLPESWEAYEKALADAQVSFETAAGAKAAYDELEEAKNALQAAVPVYLEIRDAENLEDGTYVLVSASKEKHAVTSNAALGYTNLAKKIYRNFVMQKNAAYEWQITKTDSGYTIASADDAGSYLNLTDTDAVMGPDAQNLTITSVDDRRVSLVTIGDGANYLSAGDSDATVATEGDATKFYLYKAGYVFHEEDLYEVICNANGGEYVFDESAYSVETWDAYVDALEAAKIGAFTIEDANKLLEDLDTAVRGLVKEVNAEFADIDWKITTAAEDKVTNLSYLNTDGPTEDGLYERYEALTWKWSQISNVVNADANMEPLEWTTAAYNGMSYKKYDSGASGWETANVFKISGTFAWPDGYEVDNTNVILRSANDFYYYDLYKYLEETGYDDLFPLGKVLPIDDDVYAVIWAGDDRPNVVDPNNSTENDNDINDYLAFWAGTSAKGIWSERNHTGNDWGRTTPATFLEYNLQGERTFYRSYPNAVGTGMVDPTDRSPYDNGDVKTIDNDWFIYTNHEPNQFGGWYALMDGTSLNSVLRNQYGEETGAKALGADTEIHIDLYVFNTDVNGYIDELQIEFVEERPEYVDVTVEYYYGTSIDDDETVFLGEESLLQKVPGDVIDLYPGTVAGQLNSYKGDAIAEAGSREVYDGMQLNPGFVVTEDADRNIIKVLYVPKTQQFLTLIAESAEIEYDGNNHLLSMVTIEQRGLDGSVDKPINPEKGTYTLPDGNRIVNVYSKVQATAPGIYANNFKQLDGSTPVIYVEDKDTNLKITESYTMIHEPGMLTITTNTVEETFTYDFGVENVYSNVLKKDAANHVDEIDALSVSTDKDYVTVDLDENTLTYVPQSVNTGETVTLTLEYTGGYTVEKIVNLVPTGNTLYEEEYFNIVSDDKDDTSASWATDGIVGSKTVADNHNTVYGYSLAYNTMESHSNGSALKATLGLNDGSGIEGLTAKTYDAATFTFTGTGFDLLSKCGTDTGMLLVKVQGEETQKTRAYIVDTYFTGDGEYIASDSAAAYQVPVIREMNLTEDTYTVTVYGYLVDTAGAMTYAMRDDTPAVPVEDILMVALEECGMDDISPEEVEVTYMDDNSVLNGGTGNVCGNSGIGTFALNAVQEDEGNTTDTAYVYLDGFRVYQNGDSGEGDVKYASLFDFVQTSANDLSDWTDNTALYVEYDGALEVASVADYKNYGPENEVYLTGKNAVVFALEKYDDGDIVQVSAKTVAGEAIIEGESLGTTEMYYDITEMIDYDRELGVHYVVIQNEADVDGGILSLSALKISSDIEPMASAELGEKAAVEITGEENAFVPEVLDITTSSSAKAGRSFTIKAEASKDVSKLEIVRVNPETGDEEDPVEVTASNTKAVAAGKADLYKYSKAFKESVTGEYTYRVYVYNSENVKSNAYTVTIRIVE